MQANLRISDKLIAVCLHKCIINFKLNSCAQLETQIVIHKHWSCFIFYLQKIILSVTNFAQTSCFFMTILLKFKLKHVISWAKVMQPMCLLSVFLLNSFLFQRGFLKIFENDFVCLKNVNFFRISWAEYARTVRSYTW